ncbi:MAG: hypothetical protein ACKO6C_06155 [Alphaproteobacteria bacterium]
MGEARGYAVSVNSFFTQYDRYPGDSDTSVGTNNACTGDRDNLIEYLNSPSANSCSEGLDAWNDLKDIGAIDLALTLASGQTGNGTSVKATIDSMVPVTNIPGSKTKGNGWAFDNILNVTGEALSQNYVVLTGVTVGGKTKLIDTGTTLDRAASPALSAPDALSIDSKIDDGKTNAGNIRGYNANNNAAETTCRDGANYKVGEGTKKVCTLAFRVDVSS